MEDCLFCKIIKGELPGNFVYQGKEIVAFKDTHPSAPVHVLIVPKKHFADLLDAEKEDQALLGEIQLLAAELAKQLKIDKAFKMLVNNGRGAGQAIFHLHYHLLGGWKS